MGGGIAVNILGHAHPDLQKALSEQSQTLWHCSIFISIRGKANWRRRWSIGLATEKSFSNSGAESNEGLYKLARRYGHAEGVTDPLHSSNRSMVARLPGSLPQARQKFQEGFGPLVSGFQHAVFNDLRSCGGRISPSTVAVMLEGIQGEGGIHPATPEFL